MVLIPLMVFASGGLNIFSHYCHSHHEESFSILSSPECNHEHQSSCCNEHHGHCKMNHHGPSCCENHHIYVKTVEWNFIENPLEIEDLVLDPQSLVFYELEIPDYNSKIPLGYRYVDFSSPPEFSPKYITVFQQKLRLDC